MAKKIYRQNFSIQNCHYQMATPALYDMIYYQPQAFRGLIREFIFVQERGDNTASYVPVNQIRALVEKTIAAIVHKPGLINKIHRQTGVYIEKYWEYSRRLSKLNLSRLSDRELAGTYDKLIYHQMIHHGWSLATTWFVDSDGEDFSKLLMAQATALAKGGRYAVPEIFSTLTTPDRPSLALQEEKEALGILKLIKRSRTATRIFKQKDVAKIEKDLFKLSPNLKRKIMKHYRKWFWTPFTYIGPVYELDYYLAIWSGWLREGLAADEKIKEIKNYTANVKKRKTAIIRQLGVSAQDQPLFQIASDIIYLKAYRKDAIFFGMYVLDKLLREIGRRLHLSVNQMRFMAFWEVAAALKKGSFPAETLNDRFKFSIFQQKGRRGVIYTGEAAKRFFKKLKIEKEKIKKTSRLTGTVACPGRARGRVKVINLPSEMGKMEKGDIMVAHTTFPALVPAMKKAAAIITDDGGITCHAAIVARELKTPCVVGTKHATQILHDGQLVEVDASQGIVKIIK